MNFQSFQLGRECARAPHATRLIGLHRLAEIRAMMVLTKSTTTDEPKQRAAVVAPLCQWSPEEAF